MIKYLFNKKPLKKSKVFFLGIEPPKPKPDRRKIAVVAIVKDEEKILCDWLDFHINSGIKDFIIYNNNSTDGTSNILNNEKYKKYITEIDWRYQCSTRHINQWLSTQVFAYAHAIATFGERYEKFAFIDIDEYLVPMNKNSIISEIDKLSNYSNVSLPWHMFGFSGHTSRPSGDIVLNYTNRSKILYENNLYMLKFKCIVDPCKVSVVGIHEFQTIDMENKSANTEGNISENQNRINKDFISSKNIQLNHYFTRSREDLKEKLRSQKTMRQNLDHWHRRVNKLVEEIERDTVEDTAAIEFLAAAKRAREAGQPF